MGVIYRGIAQLPVSMQSTIKLTEEYQRGRKGSNDSRITALLHDRIDNGDSETSKDRRERTHADVGNVVGGIAIADVLEEERPIEADKPTRQAKEQLCERRMHVKVVLMRDIVRCELSEMDFIESMSRSGQ